jgi:effector-binding domain-containing protein
MHAWPLRPAAVSAGRSSRRVSILAAISALLLSGMASAIEEAAYRVVRSEADFEIRDYEPQIVAETRVSGDFKQAGDDAFRPLFRYISGANQAGEDIAMTAPVAQGKGEKIAMTAPVGQRASKDEWVVSFMMPAAYTMETIPQPTDPRVRIRAVPPQRMAAIRYSGRWTLKGYQQHLDELQSWMVEQGLEAVGEPVWARYNSPFSLWFMRRNEILIPIEGGE